jgi:hypothetical protein
MRAALLASLLVLLLLVPSTPARQVEIWDYDRLFKEADVVVIASAQGTADSSDEPPVGRWKANLIGQRTTFTVLATLKGRVGDGPLAVRHFRVREGVATMDGPLLVQFRTEGPVIEGGGRVKYKAQLSTPQYLLFLRRVTPGVYEPVSGQVDSALSVKEIYAPLPAVMDEEARDQR